MFLPERAAAAIIPPCSTHPPTHPTRHVPQCALPHYCCVLPLQLVTYGCDTFDSCYPTRVGRHGTMLTKDGPLRVVSRARESMWAGGEGSGGGY